MAFTANAQLLWKISGNGLKEPSYVFGTHHFAPLSIVDSIPQLLTTLKSVDQVCGEIVLDDMESPAVMQALQQAVIIPGDTTLQTLYTSQQYEELATKLKSLLGADISQLNKIKPAFLINQMNMLFAIKSVKDYNPQLQIDTWLQAQAKEMQKRVLGLETTDFQIGILFDSQSLNRQARMLLCSVNNAYDIERQIGAMTSAYMAQDIAQLEKIINTKYHNELDALPEEENLLFFDRNKNWVKLMPSIMKNGSTLFVVGAGHLIGKNGLIDLLKNSGYTVEGVR